MCSANKHRKFKRNDRHSSGASRTPGFINAGASISRGAMNVPPLCFSCEILSPLVCGEAAGDNIRVKEKPNVCYNISRIERELAHNLNPGVVNI